MGFLMIVWIAVVGSASALLAGWALGTPGGAGFNGALSPEVAAVGLALAVVVVDAAQSVRRRWRR
jgi:hypothetical protein